MKALITGGAGFIGSHLAERMIRNGWHVLVLDDLSTGSVHNLSAVFGHTRFEFIQGTVLDAAAVGRLVSQCDLVVHLAAAVGVRYVLERPLLTIKTNVDGSDIVLEAAARFHRKTLIASTSEVYGKNPAESLCEDADSILGPASVSRWSYATAKKIDEFLALAYARTCGLPVVVARFFNIVGPGQSGRYGMVLPTFVRAALAGRPIPVFGDGLQTRNFTFVTDCIDALALLIESGEAEGEIVNIGGKEEISILDLAGLVKSVTGSSSPIARIPYSDAYPGFGFEDMRRRVPCLCKIRRLTGWSPVTPLDEMIRASARYEQDGAVRQSAHDASPLAGRRDPNGIVCEDSSHCSTGRSRL